MRSILLVSTLFLSTLCGAQSLFSWEMAYRQSIQSPFMGMQYPSPINTSNMDSGYHSPKRATIYSAILPGLGQFYNKKYWKVGLIYGGGIALGVFLDRNLDSMNSYQNALDARLDTISGTVDNRYADLSDAKVIQERNYYRRNRDMLILGFIGLYALQVIDANVDAHLREFEINDELSMSVDPDFGYSFAQRQWNSQLRLSLHF